MKEVEDENPVCQDTGSQRLRMHRADGDECAG